MLRFVADRPPPCVHGSQIETAVSKAIFDNEKRLREQGAAMHATLRQVPRDQIIWGFKILYKPLQDKVGKTVPPQVVTKDMAKSLFDKASRVGSGRVESVGRARWGVGVLGSFFWVFFVSGERSGGLRQ